MNRILGRSIVVIILIIAVMLRFLRYFDRWGLAYDQAHDAIVARYALLAGEAPLVGPFSSAGAFQTSGVWYWFIMLATAVYPSEVITPWVMLTIAYVFLVMGMIWMGWRLWGVSAGLIVGFFTAISTAQLAQGVSLTNQSPLALTSFGALASLILAYQTNRRIWLFILGFFVSLSGSIHLQGAALVVVPLIFMCWRRLLDWRGWMLLGVGFIIPTIPNLIFDLRHDFFTVRSVWQYITVDQYAISLDVLGRNWRTFLYDTLPTQWAHIIGGSKEVVFILFVMLPILLLNRRIQQRKIEFIEFISIACLGMFTIVRYTRTPLFASYFVFLHPFILLLSGYIVWRSFQLSKVVGISLFALITFATVAASVREISYGTNQSDIRARTWRQFVRQTYPGELFTLYDFEYKSSGEALVFSLYLEADKLSSPAGRYIGVARVNSAATTSGSLLLVDQGVVLLDLSSSTAAQLAENDWVRVTAQDVYDATQSWLAPSW